ncbi:MAG: hypothetical protein WCK09_14425 [Bacteroidota bacterium]
MKTTTRLLTGSFGMIFLMVSGFILFSAFSKPSENEKAKLVSEIRIYLDKNVKPIMQPQRVKLDQLLSVEEKKTVSQLNNRLRQLIIHRNAAGIGFISTDPFSFSQVPSFTPAQKKSEKESRDEMRRIMAQAWAIADKHEKEIDRLMSEKSTFFDTWKRGISSIVKDYLDDQFLFIGSKQLVKRFENRGIIKYYSPVAFLLWDPQQRFVGDELLVK